MAFDFALARLKPVPSAWNLFRTREEAEASLPALNERTRAANESAYEVMTLQDFMAAQRAHWLGDLRLTEVTAERYDEMLNILPPYRWERRDGVERFMMIEFTIGTLTEQYAQCNGRYFSRLVDAKDPSTWITAAAVAQHLQADGTA